MNLSKKERIALEKKSGIRIPEKDVRLEGGINDHLRKAINHEHEVKPLKQIKKELGIKDADIATMFGYANANSFRTSKAKKKMQTGLELFYHMVTHKE